MVLVKGKLYGFNMYCDQAVKKNRSVKERYTCVLKTDTSRYGRQGQQSALLGGSSQSLVCPFGCSDMEA